MSIEINIRVKKNGLMSTTMQTKKTLESKIRLTHGLTIPYTNFASLFSLPTESGFEFMIISKLFLEHPPLFLLQFNHFSSLLLHELLRQTLDAL